MRTAIVIAAIGGALLLQTMVSGLFAGRAIEVNFVLTAVVYLALTYGPVTGMLAGTAGGLAQDALSGSVVGIGGLTKTLVGFLVGVLSAQFNLSSAVPRLVMFVTATFVHELVLAGLSTLAAGRHTGLRFSAMLVQALVNALIGAAAFFVVEQGPEALQRRRIRRTSFAKKRF